MPTPNSVWDDPAMKTADNFIKFDNVGDKVAGVILSVGRKNWDDGSVAPQLLLRCDDGEDRTLTAGQIRLKAALVEARPEPGDHVAIELTQVEKRGGGKTLKHFEVRVKRGADAPVAASRKQDDGIPF
jgi:hypothetical protein